MVRVKTDAKRQAFLDAAKEVFQEKSFDRASMFEIAARVGSSKATLYRYFDSKEALFLELIRRSASEHGDEAMSFLYRSMGATPQKALPTKDGIGGTGVGATPKETVLVESVNIVAQLDPEKDVALTLTRHGQQVLKSFHTPQTLAVRRMVIAAAVDPEIGKMFYELGPRRAAKPIEHYFSCLVEAGTLRRADPQVIARHFRGLLESEVYEAGLFNVMTQLNDEQIAGVVERAVDVFLRAYGTKHTTE